MNISRHANPVIGGVLLHVPLEKRTARCVNSCGTIPVASEMRDKTTDPLVKKNADKTIASLLPFKK
ncbi:MAG: hypothetical protein ACLP1Y_02830 [Candidatus Acidiferrales bacterium]